MLYVTVPWDFFRLFLKSGKLSRDIAACKITARLCQGLPASFLPNRAAILELSLLDQS